MSTDLKISQALYEDAFSIFSGTEKNKFFVSPSYGNYFVQFQGKAYRIVHFEDMMEAYKGYFETSLSHIYTELPEEIWQVILTEKIEIDSENFIIDIYNAWKASWDETLFYGDDWEQFESNKQQSLIDFNRISFEIRKGVRELSTLADVEPERFIPAIAVAIKEQYPKEHQFYEEVVSLMTSRYHERIGNGAVFSKVTIDEFSDNEQIFFIYSVDGILD